MTSANFAEFLELKIEMGNDFFKFLFCTQDWWDTGWPKKVSHCQIIKKLY